MARADQREAQQRRTASSSSSPPRTFNDVACWPAKLAPGRSSVVALERTATGGAPRELYAARIASARSSGSGRSSKSVPMPADAASVEARSSSRTSLSASSIASARPVSATARRYAAVVTQKPGGTGSPTEISSPRLAPFPPPRSRSFRRSVSSGTTSLCGGASRRLSTSGFSASSCSPRSCVSVGSVLMGDASVLGSFSPQAAVYQRETTADRAGLLIYPTNLAQLRAAWLHCNRVGTGQYATGNYCDSTPMFCLTSATCSYRTGRDIA